MPLSEFDSHSFVIRVWLEERVDGTGNEIWRGHITHVQSGQRKYFERLEDVRIFIATHIRQLDNEVKTKPPIWKWLRGLRKQSDDD